MYGILTTLLAGRGSLLTPIARHRLFADQDDCGSDARTISASDANYAVYRAHLKRTIDEPFAMFLPG